VTDTALTPFRYGDEQVRTYEDEKGELWFVAIDVARILGYKDATHLTRVLDSDEKGLRSVETLGGEQTLSTISEAGLFHALNSARVEAARPFKRWVNHEVLPSIRRTGSYSLPGVTPAATTSFETQAHVLDILKNVIAKDYLEAKARIVLARAMGDTPEIEASARPLYIQDYLREKGATRDEVKRCSSSFGKYVREDYVAERGVEPGKRFDETSSGQVREVYAYTEADRPIFDRAWGRSYVKGFPEKKEAKKNKEKK
jgi:prophage antirepressor-like protein